MNNFEAVSNAAHTLLAAGFSVIPTGANKKASIPWAQYQNQRMTEDEAKRHFPKAARLAVIGGKVSGNLECLDFDDPTTFKPFLELLEMRCPGLPDKLLKRQTPSGGYHLVYRSASPVAGNLKLASDQAGEVRIETRGEGGYFLSPPSMGYKILSGSMTKCPTLTADEVQAIHTTARAFDLRESTKGGTTPHTSDNSNSPGSQFNQAHQVADILEAKGWKEDRRTTLGMGWTRPGKDDGTSGVLLDDTGNFYVFSANAHPLEPGQSYSAFALFTMYDHGGDFSAAAKALAGEGYGTQRKADYTHDRAKRANGAKNQAGQGYAIGLNRGEEGLKLDENQLAELLKRARERFKPVAGEAPAYPVEALGLLADACKTVTSEGQVAPEMAGQCLLATAALLVQSVANVRTLAGIKPLSLFGLTVAESGDGKSTAEEAALRAIRARQRDDGRKYRHLVEELQQVKRKKDDPAPVMPCEPYRVMKDGTVEGIRRCFKEGLPSQGCFTSEAAVVLGGYGMSAEHKGKSAGNLNALWDDGEISVARGGEGRLQLYDRRLSLHWLVQPDVAYQAIHDPMLSSIGFWPRFLLARPAPSPPLKALRFEPEQFSAIREYWGRCEELLDLSLGEDCSRVQVIPPTAEAEKMACRFYEKMQIEAKTEGGGLTMVKPFAVRATEQAFRVAGVSAAFSGHHEIDVEAMKNGITLAAYSLDSWRAVFGDQDDNAGRSWALSLYEWLLRQAGQRATTKAMLQIITPKHMRSKSKRDTSLALLQQEGLVGNDRDMWYATAEGVR